MQRPSLRLPDQMRGVHIDRGYIPHAEGSALIAFGNTRVLCTASVEAQVPRFLRGSRKGWVTAEYAMLPRATAQRSPREVTRGHQGGRSMEIQRLIGRVLRACVNTEALGEHTITVDCDVLQADGGTRTAAITGAYVALHDAISTLGGKAVYGQVAAVSVGIYRGVPVLDMDYSEDKEAEADLNVAMNESGMLIEIQGTAEGHAFSRDELDRMLQLAYRGTQELIAHQRKALDKKGR